MRKIKKIVIVLVSVMFLEGCSAGRDDAEAIQNIVQSNMQYGVVNMTSKRIKIDDNKRTSYTIECSASEKNTELLQNVLITFDSEKKGYIVNIEMNDAGLKNLNSLVWLNEVFGIIGSNLEYASWNFNDSSYNLNKLLKDSYKNIQTKNESTFANNSIKKELSEDMSASIFLTRLIDENKTSISFVMQENFR